MPCMRHIKGGLAPDDDIFPPRCLNIIHRLDVQFCCVLQRKFAAGISGGDGEILKRER